MCFNVCCREPNTWSEKREKKKERERFYCKQRLAVVRRLGTADQGFARMCVGACKVSANVFPVSILSAFFDPASGDAASAKDFFGGRSLLR